MRNFYNPLLMKINDEPFMDKIFYTGWLLNFASNFPGVSRDNFDAIPGVFQGYSRGANER